ncbi:hypothetical protein [Rhodococcus opacus]|uniref:hypothetical protein n=1 Tax=Rhodococcus opacus TaxID=37919 RepID=UPI002235F64C|nr:hypothetical protein [Rhodococcus opacus]UZG60197.1 hypothetical protein ONE62_41625 [Rhodococcus opacus]
MTSSAARSRPRVGAGIVPAVQALRAWTALQVLAAITAAVAVAVAVGVATVLIPNPVFVRDIPPVWWNFPVWLVTSALSGMLVATYVRANSADGPGDLTDAVDTDTAPAERDGGVVARRSSRMGMVGGVLAWFAVGCPVCNKLALLALGYAGAITWFAPVQPFLALGALILTGVALVWRLRGQVACPVRPEPVVVAR